jgi:DNA-3-methyladenine glycosylase
MQLPDLEQSSAVVAPQLLGCYLVRAIDGAVYRGMIVETEAYDQTDPACHGYQRMTPRNRAIFGRAGTIYVYRIYGIHFCVNIVCDRPNFCSAVLIRALDMQSLPPWAEPTEPKARVAAGPAKLCRLLKIDLRLNGQELSPPSGLWLEQGEGQLSYPIYQTTRIGITKGVEIPWRWYLQGHPAVSRK